MARMIGKSQWHPQCPYGCCRGWKDKTTTKQQEKTQWTAEAADELYDERDERHARGICFDPKTKMYGCDYCYDSTDYFDASELDGVKGVWTDAERLIY